MALLGTDSVAAFGPHTSDCVHDHPGRRRIPSQL